MNLKWLTPEEAEKLPEGSIVLIHRYDRELHHYRAMEICTHFRPDWVKPYYGGDLVRYAVLTDFVKMPIG